MKTETEIRKHLKAINDLSYELEKILDKVKENNNALKTFNLLLNIYIYRDVPLDFWIDYKRAHSNVNVRFIDEKFNIYALKDDGSLIHS